VSIICRVFGHAPVASYSDHAAMGGGDYATSVGSPYTDGAGRQHIALTVMCPRCGERYLGAKIHAHWITDALEQSASTANNGAGS